jgi:hypothetical protein
MGARTTPNNMRSSEEHADGPWWGTAGGDSEGETDGARSKPTGAASRGVGLCATNWKK